MSIQKTSKGKYQTIYFEVVVNKLVATILPVALLSLLSLRHLLTLSKLVSSPKEERPAILVPTFS